MIEFFLYVRKIHYITKKYKVVKVGITNNIYERECTYKTGEYIPGYFSNLYKINYNREREHFDKEFKKITLCHNKIGLDDLGNTGGTEFYDILIIDKIDNYLKNMKDILNYKALSKDEIELNTREKNIDNIKLDEFGEFGELDEFGECFSTQICEAICDKYKWNMRDYQTKIIEYCSEQIKIKRKIYIELPTGGGKSYIVYNIFKKINPDLILIISPRKIVNAQNINDNYLSILKQEYDVFNYSEDTNFEDFLKHKNKKIIVCCTQSILNAYKTIIDNDIINISVWFDEAHWGIEEWVNNLDNSNIKSLLLEDTYINERIFTSASPNKDIVNNHKNIFGELYSPIKVKELIKLNWLANIETHIYNENKEDINNTKYIIRDFIDYNSMFGFSFHNKQKNAFNLFFNHYTKYINKETSVKPFLLVSDSFNSEREPRLNNINLQYDFKDIKTFESNPYSIGYVVAKYSMGYDFNKIDFISISDPKLSVKDIIQCIGRGLRPDQLGEHGSNKNKKLILLLPVYINENDEDENENCYKVIVNVLLYLIQDIGLPIKDIKFKNRYDVPLKYNKGKTQNIEEYDGDNFIMSKILNLLSLAKNRISRDTSYEKARKIIAGNNITWHSLDQYYELCEEDLRLTREPEIVFKGKFTNWIEYLSIERVYYDLETCKNKVCEYLSIYPEIKKHYLELSIVSNELCKIDAKFPPNGLWCEYYDINDLTEIFKHDKNEELVEF